VKENGNDVIEIRRDVVGGQHLAFEKDEVSKLMETHEVGGFMFQFELRLRCILCPQGSHPSCAWPQTSQTWLSDLCLHCANLRTEETSRFGESVTGVSNGVDQVQPSDREMFTCIGPAACTCT
jgi:hypothetical protein